ncbi:MAG TPA: hypothetical protein VG963_00260, partial [Polyangiaceae bacterium]|nr:hypothetical protein [Polyangiaceae bacterium]
AQVTPEQAGAACHKLQDAVAARFDPAQTVDRVCQLYGAALTDDPMSCKNFAAACVTNTMSGNNPQFSTAQLDFASQIQCQDDNSGLTSCPLAVGDLEQCLADRMQAVSDLLAQLDCASAASIDMTSAATFLAQLTNGDSVASCQQVHSQCPGADPLPGADGQ